MDKFSHWERHGIKDFLNSEAAVDTIFPVVRIVSKNVLSPKSNSGCFFQNMRCNDRIHLKYLGYSHFSEGIEMILLHSTSIQSILNRKAITKENLFKYLHSKTVSVTSEFTKQLLIEKILQYWKQTFYLYDDDDCSNPIENQASAVPGNNIAVPQTSQQILSYDLDQPEHFPINQMARKFATWFYENLNCNQLQVSDFWNNCKCAVQFLEDQNCIMEEEHLNAQAVLDFCQSLLSKYDLFFNLNISHSGTQGRIDCHGLVLVLTCGTLHKFEQLVGTFETVFGLSRDPFSQNNWKINRIKLRLHNFYSQQNSQNDASLSIEQPTLSTSNSIVPLLALSMPKGDDEIG